MREQTKKLSKRMSFTVKWKKVVVQCDLSELKTIGELRTFLKAKTLVPRKKQKLFFKGKALPVSPGSTTLESLGVKARSKVVCVGKAVAAKGGNQAGAEGTKTGSKAAAGGLQGGTSAPRYKVGDLVTRAVVDGAGKDKKEVCAVVEVYPGSPAAPEFYTLQVSTSFDPLRVGREVQVPAGE